MSIVSVLLMGGLGNQLFQLAAAYAFSRENNALLHVDLSYIKKYSAHGGYRLNNLIVSDVVNDISISSSSKWNLISYRFIMKMPWIAPLIAPKIIHDSFDKTTNSWSLVEKKDITMLGYWQNAALFAEHRSFFRETIIPKNISVSANIIREKLIKSNSISLHVRRGDYVNNSKALSVHGVCGESFYKSAISYIKERVRNPHFFIFTNDHIWAKNILSVFLDDNSMTFINGNSQEEDLWLMSQAKHHIIANSSFSWWGAWLAQHEHQIVIAPTPWYDNPPMYSHDPSLADWIRLPK